MPIEPMRSGEFVDELLELELVVDAAMEDGVVTPLERRAIKRGFRLIVSEGQEADAALRKIATYARNWRLTPGHIRYHGGDVGVDGPGEAA